MSLIYGYNNEKDDDNNNSGGSGGDVSDLEKLVGLKTDSKTVDSVFGKIRKNKEDIQTKGTLLGSRGNPSTMDSAFGRIKKNKEDIQNRSTLLGFKANASTVDSAFGRIKKNKEDIIASTSFVGSASSSEGESNLKGTQLSHASAITAHSNNLLELEGNLGVKTDDRTMDSAFGRIQKNKENIEKIKHAVELKETTGTFVAPFNDGKVEIIGWSMTRYSTIIAIIIKAEPTLFGVSRVTLYSGSSLSNNNHTMTVPMSIADMKLGKPAVIIHTKDPGHARMYANTRGNAVGSVGERTVSVKFIYIDHTTPVLN